MNAPRPTIRRPRLRRVLHVAAYVVAGIAAVVLLVHASDNPAPLTTGTVLAGGILLALGLPVEVAE